MTNTALLYRPTQRWRTWIAFACAIGLHFVAISLARTVPEVPSFPASTDIGIDVTIGRAPDEMPVEPEKTSTPPPEPVKSDEAFPEETPKPRIRRSDPQPLQAIRPVQSTSSRSSFSSFKVLATYAPRPDYPFEARRQHATGSGVVVLTIDSSTGTVSDARVAQSTGSEILDNSAVSTFRRWRFKLGTTTNVRVPITFTLSGASY
jgi:TonB family protein